MSGFRLRSCQQEGLSKFRDVRSEPDQEKAAASDKDVNRKKCQSRKGSVVPARRPGVVPIGPPFSLY